MKKFKVMLSIFMVFVIISISAVPVFAVIAPEDAFSGVQQSQNKIHVLLIEKMSTASDEELIPVWVWMTEPDLSDVESMVKKQTGLTKDDLCIGTDVSTTKVAKALGRASTEDTESARINAENELRAYFDATKEARKIEKERTNTYINARRNITKELYVENNSRIISQFNLESQDIRFQSQLTPSIIVELTKSEIIEISKNEEVVSLYYYDSTPGEPPINMEAYKDTTQIDAVVNKYGLTGEGVNILMNDHGFIRSDLDYYSNIGIYENDEENGKVVKNVFNKTLFDTTNLNALPVDDYAVMDHANYVASVLRRIVEDVSIYSTSHGKFTDIEYALTNDEMSINIINASVNYNNISTNYENDPVAKWFDALAYQHKIPIIASAGNYRTAGVDACISPACGYNTIAVGSYVTDGISANDFMRKYKYAPITGTATPCYKPDIVAPGYGTSGSAPVVSSIVALLLEAKPSLQEHPEVIKAILMASCHRKVKPAKGDEQENMEDGLTQKQGAGAVDAYRALKIALEGTYGQITTVASGEATTRRFTLTQDDDVNVSIAWFKENTYTSKDESTVLGNNIYDLYDVNSNSLQELELKVYCGSNSIGSSAKTNTAKQMVYLKNLLPDTTYRIAVKKNSASNKSVTYGYAWSGQYYEQTEIKLTGKIAVGQTLTAEPSYIDGKEIVDNNILFDWKRSSDGTNWQMIPDANENTYTITQSDWDKYIMCDVSFNDDTLSGDTNVSVKTDTKVFLYGDVDWDGEVSVMDATVLQSYLAGSVDLSLAEQLYAADVNDDGEATLIDVTIIQEYCSGDINSLPVAK